MLNEKLREYIEDMTTEELITLHNEYCREVYDYDSIILPKDELDEELRDLSPLRIISMTFYGNYEPLAEYFTYNGNGNIKSVYERDILDNVYITDIINYIIRNDEALNDNEIREILDEYNN